MCFPWNTSDLFLIDSTVFQEFLNLWRRQSVFLTQINRLFSLLLSSTWVIRGKKYFFPRRGEVFCLGIQKKMCLPFLRKAKKVGHSTPGESKVLEVSQKRLFLCIERIVSYHPGKEEEKTSFNQTTSQLFSFTALRNLLGLLSCHLENINVSSTIETFSGFRSCQVSTSSSSSGSTVVGSYFNITALRKNIRIDQTYKRSPDERQ